MPFNNWPPQFFAAFMKGGSSAPKHMVTISMVNGQTRTVTVREGTVRSLIVEPLKGYLPPLSVTKPAGVTSFTYDKYTGLMTVGGVTSDVTISGTCVAIPKTFDAMKTFDTTGMTYDMMKLYGLTYDKLKG